MSASTSRPERLHGLDALRAGALLLGVVLHATLSFFPTRIWLVADDARSPWAYGLFFFIHLPRMTVFFVLAGFFAHAQLHRCGTSGFVKDRLARIAAPLVVLWAPVFAAIVVVTIWNAVRQGGTAAAGAPPPGFGWKDFPLTHLWFLWMLLLLYAAMLAVRAVAQALDRDGVARRCLDRYAGVASRPWGAVVLALPLAVALDLEPGWIAAFGIPTPDHGFVPGVSSCVGFGMAFGTGLLLDRRRDLLTAIERRAPINLALALVAGIAALMLSGGFEPRLAPIAEPMSRAAAALSYAVATWAGSLAAIGVALRLFSTHSAARRHVADASYWIYIVHLPLVMVAQVLVQPLDWPWFAKLVAVVCGTLAVSMASYELLIRYTLLGRWLNGRRVRLRKTTPGRSSLLADPADVQPS